MASMSYTDDQLESIYDRTDGCCHLCHKKLAFTNYGAFGERGAWEVEHSVPRARGGTNHGNNLFPACISCNRGKQHGSSRTARARLGHQRAPYGRKKKQRINKKRRVVGYLVGVAAGGAVAGPPGAVIGGIVGAALGHHARVRR
jgi:5-methylcytosine-specific restriction endonuclease McrA